MPSSHLLNMAGEFKVCRNIQIVTCVVLLISMVVGGILWGVYGMLVALLVTTLLLDVLEMGYVHTRFFPGKLLTLAKLLLPLLLSGALTCYVEISLSLTVNSYLTFVLFGVLLVVVNGVIAALVCLLFNRRDFMALFKRVLRILKRA